MGHALPMKDAAARKRFNEELLALNLRVHDPDDPPLFTREPVSPMAACHWKWKDLGPLFARLGKEIDLGSGGQRRTLRLHNPGLAYGTTLTFWGSIQHILPGEVAEAHRHMANALRFITHGSGATTTVDGERYAMSEGDLVLTPSWCWHDHQHHGAEPMTWLDILDISLVRSMHAVFFEPYPQPKQPVLREGSNPRLSCPMARAEAALARVAAEGASDPHADLVLDYQGKLAGELAFPNLGLQLVKLRPGFAGRPRRQVASVLYHVVRGEGTTLVGDRRYEWKQGDYMAVPPWSWHQHENTSRTTDALFFRVDDSLAMKALGYYREETR